jgi:hypothetical protein
LGKSKAGHRRRLARLRLARRQVREQAKRQGVVYADIPNRDLSDRLTIVLAQNGTPRKMAAVFFRNRTADLYVAMPYLNLERYTCGTLEGQSGKEVRRDTESGTTTSRRPVKLSYHESGQVHIKSQGGADSRILASVQAPALAELRGNHIFTLELEGVDYFDVAKDAELRKQSTIAISLPQAAWRVRIVGYAGYTAAQLHGKYTSEGAAMPPSVRLRFVRPRLPGPLFLDLYIITTGSLQKGRRPVPMQMAVAGFEEIAGGHKAVFTRGDGFTND